MQVGWVCSRSWVVIGGWLSVIGSSDHGRED